MGTFPFDLKTYILFSRWRQSGQSWCGCGGYCITKIRITEIVFKVSHMNVNHHYHLHPYYHDFWCFDIIYLMLHHLYLQSHLNHCFTRFVQKYQSVVVRRQWCLSVSYECESSLSFTSLLP